MVCMPTILATHFYGGFGLVCSRREKGGGFLQVSPAEVLQSLICPFSY